MSKKQNTIQNPAQITRTAKLKLKTTKEDYQELINFAKLVNQGLNYASKIAFEHNFMSNKAELQKLVYQDLRNIGLTSQISVSICREVSAKYKGLKTRRTNFFEAQKKQKRKKRFTGLDKPVEFKQLFIHYQTKKDYTIKDNNLVSIKTQTGRSLFQFFGYNKHIEEMKENKLGMATLTFDKKKKTVYLLVPMEIKVEKKELIGIKGIDVGIRKLAVTKTNDTIKMYSGKEIAEIRGKFLDKREELQAKGTSSARRRLKALAGKERRFMRNVNHCLSKEITKEEGWIIGMEDLVDIRFTTDPVKNKKHSKKKKRANIQKTSWSFDELQSMIEYKNLEKGGMVIYVDPAGTSIGCPECGYEHKENRKNKGEIFKCLYCDYTEDADVVGAGNISYRAFVIKHLEETGQLSNVLDVTGDKKRSWFRLRFHPLVSSLVTSFAL